MPCTSHKSNVFSDNKHFNLLFWTLIISNQWILLVLGSNAFQTSWRKSNWYVTFWKFFSKLQFFFSYLANMFLMVVVNLYASSWKNDLWFAFFVLFSFHFLLCKVYYNLWHLLELWNRNLLHLCMERTEIELGFDEIYGTDARIINYLLLLVLHSFFFFFW